MATYMLLPSHDVAKIRLLRIPNDYEGQEAFRHITGLIADVEARNSKFTWDDIAEHLETQGYEVMKFLLGPSLD